LDERGSPLPQQQQCHSPTDEEQEEKDSAEGEGKPLAGLPDNQLRREFRRWRTFGLAALHKSLWLLWLLGRCHRASPRFGLSVWHQLWHNFVLQGNRGIPCEISASATRAKQAAPVNSAIGAPKIEATVP